jgi:predicted nucleotidyltransferase
MNDHQKTIADRVLDEESRRRRHLVISLSGAHAYGFPSPDSDLDLKAVHIEPTSRLLGLANPPQTFDRLEVIEGVEIDYTSNELQMVLAGLVLGNGNYFERILGPIAVRTSQEHEDLRPLAKRAVSKRVHRHYAGFSRGQLHEFTVSPKAKKILYVLRTALTGIHALATGEIVTDVNHLIYRYGFSEARELIEQKRRGERIDLPDELRDKWTKEIERAFAQLEEARQKSPLPDEAPNKNELEAYLLEVRKRHF